MSAVNFMHRAELPDAAMHRSKLHATTVMHRAELSDTAILHRAELSEPVSVGNDAATGIRLLFTRLSAGGERRLPVGLSKRRIHAA